MNTFIFLDVDGVLNNQETKERSPDKFIGIDKKNLAVLKEFLDSVKNPAVILSSSWKICWKNHGRPNKEGRYLIDNLTSIGHEIKDFTIDCEGEPFYKVGWKRGTGIRNYLEKNEHIDYIILDDEAFNFYNCGLSKHFVQTDWKTGITASDKQKALKILSKHYKDFKTGKDITWEQGKTHYGKAISNK